MVPCDETHDMSLCYVGRNFVDLEDHPSGEIST